MPAGFVPSSLPCSALRGPAAASPSPRLNPLSSSNCQTRRCLSTTLFRASQSQTPTTQQTQAEVEAELAAAAEDLQEVETYEAGDIATQLLYPGESTTAPLAADVSDSSYKPAETGDGLEEVGGLAGWWDEPTHWGGDDGVTGFVRSVTTRFGPADKVTDPAVLEVLAKRAIVEALVAARFAGPKRKAVDRLFAHAGGMDRLGEIVGAEIVVGEDGAATLKEEDWQTTWDAVKSAARKSKPKAKTPEAEASETETAEAAEGQQDGVLEATATEVPQLTPDAAKSLVGSWDKGWKRAELKDPVVKFFVSYPWRVELSPRTFANIGFTGRQADPATDGIPHPRRQAARCQHYPQPAGAPGRAAQAEEACGAGRDQGRVQGPAQRPRLPPESHADRQGEDGGPLEDYCQRAREARPAHHRHGQPRRGGREEVGGGEGIVGEVPRAVFSASDRAAAVDHVTL